MSGDVNEWPEAILSAEEMVNAVATDQEFIHAVSRIGPSTRSVARAAVDVLAPLIAVQHALVERLTAERDGARRALDEAISERNHWRHQCAGQVDAVCVAEEQLRAAEARVAALTAENEALKKELRRV